MVDLLETGSAWLKDRRTAHLAETVTYQRGEDSISISATAGTSNFEQIDEHGLVNQLRTRDFLIEAADLVIDSVLVNPQIGDKIIETDGAVTYFHRVMSPGGGATPWRYSDPYGKVLRIHTKLVSTSGSPPIVVAAFYLSSFPKLHVVFDKILQENPTMTASVWSLRYNNLSYAGQTAHVDWLGGLPGIGDPTYPDRTVVVTRNELTESPDVGPDACTFNPPPAEVLSTYGVAAEAFAEFPYTELS